ncbi:triose-phosphate isomerase [Sphingoaurantiacus capsulatus]|uniref:Triosephosphate isomerase n=1 Tax=Sphingoaurantiacus capsulatus TaxID=1771310 RepID=A0ABV7XG18_9SPHN
MTRTKLIAGNWKMNGLAASTAELDKIIAGAKELPSRVELLICPPFTLIDRFADRAERSRVAVGAQDAHPKASGAHTGCVSAAMLKDAGATHVIVGHSERRTDQKETDAEVNAKAAAVIGEGLIAIVCVGETEAERDAGRALDVVGTQLAGSLPAGSTAANLVVAYEPVWAIGTGRTPSTADVAEMHAHIRTRLRDQLGAEGEGVRILYGGSVKASNAAELLAVADVDGALVGGASLTAEQFLPIAQAV